MRPWLKRSLARYFARQHGFIDPINLFNRLRRFAEPAAEAVPMELLRAGAAFHARGLINTQAIQNNLDWIWPFWVERQFDPYGRAFVPRAFSVTHVNLTHRNWSAVGLPYYGEFPIVDPRGLLTPRLDGWSIDAWLILPSGEIVFPSKELDVFQRLEQPGNEPVRVRTEVLDFLAMLAWVDLDGGIPTCRLRVTTGTPGSKIVISFRPYNPEGVTAIGSIERRSGSACWRLNGEDDINFSRAPSRIYLSHYSHGDAAAKLGAEGENGRGVECPAGMATAALVFDDDSPVEASIPLSTQRLPMVLPRWQEVLSGAARLKAPDERYQRLYDSALRTVILLSPGEVYPGPFTYRRFWFRDAVFMLHTLLCLGLKRHVAKALERFPVRQTARGYFLSQEGEWDSNGQAMWLFGRYKKLTCEKLPAAWIASIWRGARWIGSTLQAHRSEKAPGLLPAGFSAEHFGPSDHYYWDNFWALAGLQAAVSLLAEGQIPPIQLERIRKRAETLQHAIDRSIRSSRAFKHSGAIAVSPGRRMDSAAVGSLVASYPLTLTAAGDPRVLATAEFLYQNCLVDGALFHQNVHSGFNAYLTLHLAQTLLRAGDLRAVSLVDAVAGLASQTGQWPEAIHPGTGGGCMGDGQHGWAAAEWLMMIKNMFVAEEEGGRVRVLAGVPCHWLIRKKAFSFGPVLTASGSISVSVEPNADSFLLTVEGATDRARVEFAYPSAEIRAREDRAGVVRFNFGLRS